MFSFYFNQLYTYLFFLAIEEFKFLFSMFIKMSRQSHQLFGFFLILFFLGCFYPQHRAQGQKLHSEIYCQSLFCEVIAREPPNFALSLLIDIFFLPMYCNSSEKKKKTKQKTIFFFLLIFYFLSALVFCACFLFSIL